MNGHCCTLHATLHESSINGIGIFASRVWLGGGRSEFRWPREHLGTRTQQHLERSVHSRYNNLGVNAAAGHGAYYLSSEPDQVEEPRLVT
jgi:hypothetical protein